MKLTSQLKGEDETLDTFYSGRILVFQKKKGYRFSVDAPLLADFIRTKASDELLELGTGNGIISLLLSIKPFKSITAVEIQESLAAMARRNVKLNNLEEKIQIIEKDLRALRPEKKFDIVFSNPPYIKKKAGHLSPSAEKSIAKHELKCNINDIVKKTYELLKEDGRAYFILRFIHPRQETPPNLFLAEVSFSSRKSEILPPFILYDEKGEYTPEANKVFQGRINAASD